MFDRYIKWMLNVSPQRHEQVCMATAVVLYFLFVYPPESLWLRIVLGWVLMMGNMQSVANLAARASMAEMWKEQAERFLVEWKNACDLLAEGRDLLAKHFMGEK